MSPWTPWFACRPVRLRGGWVWRVNIRRRHISDEDGIGYWVHQWAAPCRVSDMRGGRHNGYVLWFAWRPVRLEGGYVWRVHLLRKRGRDGDGDGYGTSRWFYRWPA